MADHHSTPREDARASEDRSPSPSVTQIVALAARYRSAEWNARMGTQTDTELDRIIADREGALWTMVSWPAERLGDVAEKLDLLCDRLRDHLPPSPAPMQTATCLLAESARADLVRYLAPDPVATYWIIRDGLLQRASAAQEHADRISDQASADAADRAWDALEAGDAAISQATASSLPGLLVQARLLLERLSGSEDDAEALSRKLVEGLAAHLG